MVIFDPQTDFTITPWLKEELKNPLHLWDVIGGDWIIVPKAYGEIRLYGCKLNLVGKLEPTGIGLDQTMFLTMETAQAMAEASLTKAAEPLEIPAGKISAVQVKVKKGYSIEDVAQRIMTNVPGTYAIQSMELIRIVQRQTAGLFRALFLALGIIWVLAVVLTGFVFSLMVGERRREIGLLRAVGAKRRFIFNLFLTESAILGLGGGIAGMFFSIAFVYLFRIWLMLSARMPLLIPPLPTVIGYMMVCLVIALALALPALLYPALRASNIDPAEAMREV
jgi:putative ABC transport system permease protein